MSDDTRPNAQAAWDRWYRLALPAYWMFLFCSTHLPPPESGATIGSDKLAHFAAFALLTFVYWRFMEALSRPLTVYFVWIAASVLLAYAAFDEYLQQFVHRSPGWGDWASDAAGIVVVLAVLEWRRRRQNRFDKPGD